MSRKERAHDGAIVTGGDRAVAVTAHVVLILWSLLVILPLLWTVFSSLKPRAEVLSSAFGMPSHFTLANYGTAWTDGQIGKALANTIFVVGLALVLVMLMGSMCAYVLAKFDFRGNRAVYYLMLAGLTFPIFLAIVPLSQVLQQLYLTGRNAPAPLVGLALTYTAFALPFTVFFLYSFFKSLPNEVSEAASIDGAGRWRTFFQVMFPMAKAGVASIAIMNFLGLWNQYLLPAALNPKQENWVLSQAVASMASQAGYETDFGKMFAAAVIVIAPVLVVYVIFQRQLQGSVSQGTSK